MKKEREFIMKKVIMMLVMLFTMSIASFAEDNNTTEIQKYMLSINVNKLANYLELTTDQVDAVETVVNELSRDLMFAAVECTNMNRNTVTKNAVNKNVKYMSYILNDKQYHKYLLVLNATINNRGLNY